MSGNEPHLAAPEGALAQIASGIDKAHGELKDLTIGQQAITGRGFSELSLSGAQLGHRGLAEQFGTFCDRWGWGVRDLMQKANLFTAALGVSAGAFGEQERYVKDTLKITTNAVNGNPHLSEDQVKQKSWDEIRSQRPTDGADWRPESFREAHGEVEQTWRDTAYDVEDGLLDSMRDSGVVDPALREAMDEELREKLDPSEEAVRRAQEPNWVDR
ncbi:hypothetical protein GPZ77_16680 [Streptomyces sp. QHH-9511]|uniref:hypothetical protein n=1 Tax=Streptomyces sp. QHH-9511 TaxID=2684468 RepID=UPI0013169570|nr:hypothetical protein [Streptomyces sp. QHH-9511]QGZ49787.1 hypothetical protein GPZ77_16680 [Streptomyces sp. QHH-9511]